MQASNSRDFGAGGIRITLDRKILAQSKDQSSTMSFVSIRTLLASFLLAGFSSIQLCADDWPMRGKDIYRRSWVEHGTGPHFWATDKTRQPQSSEPPNLAANRIARVKWVAGEFYQAMCDPVVSQGLVWIGTANPIGDMRHDSSVLVCFELETGKLLYEHVSEKLGDSRQDWPWTGNTSSPFIQNNRLWFCSNRLEVICLDIQPLLDHSGKPTQLWAVDLKERFKIEPRDVHLGNRASRCSIVGIDGRIFVNTTHS
jgi:hypothetical protein